MSETLADGPIGIQKDINKMEMISVNQQKEI